MFNPKTTLHTSALTNYLTNLESHSAKHCHSTMPLLGVITDYTSLFNRKKKITLYKLLKKNPELQETFLNLSHSQGISDDIKSIIESFVCQMHGRKKTNSVDQARLEIFVTKNKPKKRICFSQPNSSKEVVFKHNAIAFQSLTSKDQAMYLCCKCLDELT